MKFGDRIEITVNPGLVIEISELAEAFVQRLIEAGDVDLTRESLVFGQEIVSFLGSKNQPIESEALP